MCLHRHSREQITGNFVLRRTKDVIRGSLPPALEVVVFCRPSPQQLSLYETCIQRSEGARSLLYGGGGKAEKRRGASGGGVGESDEEEEEEEEEDLVSLQGPVSLQGVLPLISNLRRLCNHPDLVTAGKKDSAVRGSGGENGSEHGGGEAETPPGSPRSDDDDDVDPPGKENSTTATAGGGRPSSKGLWKVPRSTRAMGTSTAGSSGRVWDQASASTTAEAAVEPRYETEASGKVVVLEALLRTVRREFPGDKVGLPAVLAFPPVLLDTFSPCAPFLAPSLPPTPPISSPLSPPPFIFTRVFTLHGS